jgi:hypothetical protein
LITVDHIDNVMIEVVNRTGEPDGSFKRYRPSPSASSGGHLGGGYSVCRN